MANILRNAIGAVLSYGNGSTTGASLTNNSFSVSADKLTIDNTTNKALLADFELTATFATAPITGAVQLYAVDYSLDGTTAGPAPTSTSAQPRLVGNFDPQPKTGNTATSWKMRLNNIALSNKADYYILNNGTAYTINAGWVLKAQCWSPG